MGILNKIFKGLGFEGEEEVEKSQKQDDRYNKFNLHNNEQVEKNNIPPVYANNSNTVNINNLVIYAPKNHAEIQALVDCLIKKEACIVNLGGIAESDCNRILDFLSGAIYALNGTIKRLQGDLFILAPKGIEVKNYS